MVDMMWGVGIAMQQIHIELLMYESSSMELVGRIQLACSWRPRALLRRLIIGIYKLSSIVKSPPHSYASIIWKVSTNWSTSATSKHKCGIKDSNVAPCFFFFLVVSMALFIIIFSHLSSLGSFHFFFYILSSLGFSSLLSAMNIINTLFGTHNSNWIKHDVWTKWLCQCSRMCNDLAQHVAKIWTRAKPN